MRWLLLLCWGLCACTTLPDGSVAGPPAAAEALVADHIAVAGLVVDEDGMPLSGARIEVISFYAKQSAQSTTTDSQGRWRLEGLYAHNLLLRVEHPSYYGALLPLGLQDGQGSRSLEPVDLVKKQAGRVRLITMGDCMFGRRFEDPDEDGTLGGGLIRADHRAQDSSALVRFLAPLWDDGDVRLVNFESPVSTHHSSRHPYKEFSFTSHPQTLAALQALNISAVSLGNNHCYDYLSQGLVDTRTNVEQAGLAWFGAGENEREAKTRIWRPTPNAVPMSFQGFTSIIPEDFPVGTPQPWPNAYLYVASDAPDKGGALRLNSETLGQFLHQEQKRVALPVLHGGYEYGEWSSSDMRARFVQAAANGAPLVIAHHPHVFHGIFSAGPNDSLILSSLGNGIFDQEVLETFRSAVAVVDLDWNGETAEVHRLTLLPFHQEDYVPSALTGDGIERFCRRLGHLSHMRWSADPDPELHPTIPLQTASGIRVVRENAAVLRAEYQSTLAVAVRNGQGIAQLQFPAHNTYLKRVSVNAGLTITSGRDLLALGDFEDYDVDPHQAEAQAWEPSPRRYAISPGYHSPTAWHLNQWHANNSRTLGQFRFRLTIPFDAAPETSYGLAGFYQRRNSGEAAALMEWIVRDTRVSLGEITVFTVPAGNDATWQLAYEDLRIPSGVGHLRLKLSLQPPAADLGIIRWDDLAFLAWERNAQEDLPLPNDVRWLRVQGPDGTYTLTLHWETLSLAHNAIAAPWPRHLRGPTP